MQIKIWFAIAGLWFGLPTLAQTKQIPWPKNMDRNSQPLFAPENMPGHCVDCQQVINFCMKAGFRLPHSSARPSANKKIPGNDVWLDCTHPLMQKKSIRNGKPLPAVSQQSLVNCRACNPRFGQGKIGSKK